MYFNKIELLITICTKREEALMLVDLHIHTFYSDGTMSPQDIVREARKKNLKIISITDHNTVESYDEFKKECEKNDIIGIPGVELDCYYKDKVVHILGYGFQRDENLLEVIDRAKRELLETSIRLIERMSSDYSNISNEDYEAYDYRREKGGWKGIHYLLDRGITSGLFEGFKYYKEYNCGHEQFDFPKIEEACAAIKKAGGYAVLAHPCNWFSELSKDELRNVLMDLRGKGIDGVECYYPANSKEMTEICVEFCRENDMLITAGSDGHGEFGAVSKGVEYYIGATNTDIKLLNLKDLVKI